SYFPEMGSGTQWSFSHSPSKPRRSASCAVRTSWSQVLLYCSTRYPNPILVMSAPGEDRLAALEEGRHALFEVLGGPVRGHAGSFVVEVSGDVLGGGPVDEATGVHEGRGRRPGQLPGQLGGGG